MSGIVHIAGPDIHVDDLLRQRCAWCGAVLIDYDLARVAVPEGDDRGIGTWPVGALVEVDGDASWIAGNSEDHALPENACTRIDPAVTT